MNPEVLSKAISTLRTLYQQGKSDRALLARNVHDKTQLKAALARRFRSSIGKVVEMAGLQTIEDKQKLNMALLREFPAEARGEDQEVLALVG